MTVIALSSTLAGQIKSMRLEQVRLDFTFNSAFGSQGTEVSSPLWAATLVSSRISEDTSGEWKALLMLLRGQTNQLQVWDIGRPAPRGTMRGTMVLNAATAQGDVVVTIVDATQAGATLVTGDMLQIGNQLVMVVIGGTADGSGVISVTVEPPLRDAHLIGASVVWDKPVALFRRKQSAAGWDYDTTYANNFTLELIEDTRT